MCWLQLTLGWLGAANVGIIYLVLVLLRNFDNLDVGLAALALSSTTGFSALLSQLATTVGDMEIKMNAVERIHQYILHVPQEPPETIPDTTPPATWPEKGRVKFDDLKLAYATGSGMVSSTGASSTAAETAEPVLVLKGVSARIQPGEKIGIVGRTGAGKSTLVSALFRLVEFVGGKILIDRRNISDLGLFDLRKHLSIVPQQPVLFSGTVRYNLDPFEEHTDEELWHALDQVRLKDCPQLTPDHEFRHDSNLIVFSFHLIRYWRTAKAARCRGGGERSKFQCRSTTAALHGPSASQRLPHPDFGRSYCCSRLRIGHARPENDSRGSRGEEKNNFDDRAPTQHYHGQRSCHGYG
jgi:ABC-type multidrug transport system fused ATPase/permease subunit